MTVSTPRPDTMRRGGRGGRLAVLIPTGRSHLRALLLSWLHVGMDGIACVADACKADDAATEADREHDQKLTQAEHHVNAAIWCLHNRDGLGVLKHLKAAQICVRDAKVHDATEDQHRGVIRGLLDCPIKGALRIRNRLLDGLLIAPRRRRPSVAGQMTLEGLEVTDGGQ